MHADLGHFFFSLMLRGFEKHKNRRAHHHARFLDRKIKRESRIMNHEGFFSTAATTAASRWRRTQSRVRPYAQEKYKYYIIIESCNKCSARRSCRSVAYLNLLDITPRSHTSQRRTTYHSYAMDLSSLTGKSAAAGGATSAERKEAIKQQV